MRKVSFPSVMLAGTFFGVACVSTLFPASQLVGTSTSLNISIKTNSGKKHRRAYIGPVLRDAFCIACGETFGVFCLGVALPHCHVHKQNKEQQ